MRKSLCFVDHLAGKQTIGVYPLLTDDNCYFLAADFDASDWREDAKAIMQSCHNLSIPAALEISRSGNGAHLWIFFAELVPAGEARQLGSALISHTCDRTRQLALDSYDRMFPNQDTMPRGGFGNLIALPLQRKPRESGHSVFVDDHLKPYPDQWAYLATIHRLSRRELTDVILRVCGGRHPLDAAFAIEEESALPWQRSMPVQNRITGLEQAAHHRLRRESFPAHQPAPRLSGRGAGPVAGERNSRRAAG